MTPMLSIRKTVFGASQAQFGAIAGVSQGTVSKWETGELSPGHDELARIRAEALKRGLAWNDRWFFDLDALEARP